MLKLRILILILIALFSTISFKAVPLRAPAEYPVRWLLSKDCSLKVNGSTNINKFNCSIPNYPSPDTLIFSRQKNNEAIKISGAMSLEVKNFDCHNPMMTADLRKTLKAKDFPRIIISFISLSKYPEQGNQMITGMVTIQLAGTTKHFEVDYRFVPQDNETLTLIGTKRINFSDFNITPPRKLGGMIKTNDELSVEFILKARILK
jgi:hypothetical protein